MRRNNGMQRTKRGQDGAFVADSGVGRTRKVTWAVGVAAALRNLRTKGFALALLVSATLWTGTLLMWGQHYRP